MTSTSNVSYIIFIILQHLEHNIPIIIHIIPNVFIIIYFELPYMLVNMSWRPPWFVAFVRSYVWIFWSDEKPDKNTKKRRLKLKKKKNKHNLGKQPHIVLHNI
jgi:hypothetical protein